jgi:hypothetical protein
MNTMRYWQSSLLAVGIVLIAGIVSPLLAGPYSKSAQTNIYGTDRNNGPTCCYSEEKIWEKTGSQSGWSVDNRHYDPYGFPQRDEYRDTRPDPLPRDVETGNPWSVQAYDYADEPRRTGNSGNPWVNAQFYQPPAYLYPTPVRTGMAGMNSPYGPGGLGDPYLGLYELGAPGLMYPGLGGPLGMLGPLTPLGLYGPGIGLGPGIW